MPRRPPLLRVALALLPACSLAAGCQSRDAPPRTAGHAALVVVDATGERVALDGPARRIVSLVPSATATLRAIGAASSLVGRTDYDTDAWAAAIPSVGGGLDPSVEAIVALEPDLVIRFAGEQDPRTRGRLDDLGITHLAVRPERLDDVLETTRLLSRVTGREAAGDSLARALTLGLEETARAVAEWPRLRVAYVLGGSPPWVSGSETYIAEILSLVGGDNVFSELDAAYAPVSPEELRRRDIDVVLVSTRGGYDASLTPDARVVEIGDSLEIPGPGVVDVARRVATLIHGRPSG